MLAFVYVDRTAQDFCMKQHQIKLTILIDRKTLGFQLKSSIALESNRNLSGHSVDTFSSLKVFFLSAARVNNILKVLKSRAVF